MDNTNHSFDRFFLSQPTAYVILFKIAVCRVVEKPTRIREELPLGLGYRYAAVTSDYASNGTYLLGAFAAACAGAGKARFFDPCWSRANGARANACERRPLLSDSRKLGVESSPGSGGPEAVCFRKRSAGWRRLESYYVCTINEMECTHLCGRVYISIRNKLYHSIKQ